MSATCDVKTSDSSGWTLCCCESVSVKMWCESGKNGSGRSYCEDVKSVWSWRKKLAWRVMCALGECLQSLFWKGREREKNGSYVSSAM